MTATSYELDHRPSYLAAAITAAAVFLLYLITLAPSTAMWDASEYIAAAYIMGLPHPPGNPFFIIVGRVFSILPIAPTVAIRINILAALCSAVSAGMWFLITERVLVGWLTQRWQRILGGVLAAVIGATAFTVWSQSVVNEKVYTVSLVFFAIVAWLMVRWADDPDGRKADLLLVLVAYLLGLGYSNHPAGFLAAPAVGVVVLVRRPQTLLRWKLLLACAGALLLGMTPFATQPIRAAHEPAINQGQPTACRGELAWDCTFTRETWELFKYNFNREQYGKPSLTDRQAPFHAQVGMWWHYFEWQWLRDPYNEHQGLQTFLAVLFLGLGLIGGWVHWQRDRRSFWFFGPLVFTVTFALIYYMNFKYGASQAPHLGDSVPREVRDRDYFYLWSFSTWSVWAALGLVWVWESFASLFGAREQPAGDARGGLPARRSWLLASPVLAIAFIPLFTNWDAASRAGETDTRDFAHDLLNSLEPYAILVTVGDNDTFPLWYAQEVEGIRRDVVVTNTSLLNTDWYVRQIAKRPVYEYDREKGPAIYRDREWPMPTEPIVSWTEEEIEQLPLYQVLNTAATFEVPGTDIRTTLQPQVLERADLFVLKMVQDNRTRPVYFSRTAVNYPSKFGFTPFLLTQGFANKLLHERPEVSLDTLPLPGQGWLDVKRSHELWTEVFEGQASLIRKGGWVDRPSVGIPYLYVDLGLHLSDAMRVRGDTNAAAQYLRQTRDIAQVMRLDEMVALIDSVQPEAPPVPFPSDTTTRPVVPVVPAPDTP